MDVSTWIPDRSLTWYSTSNKGRLSSYFWIMIPSQVNCKVLISWAEWTVGSVGFRVWYSLYLFRFVISWSIALKLESQNNCYYCADKGEGDCGGTLYDEYRRCVLFFLIFIHLIFRHSHFPYLGALVSTLGHRPVCNNCLQLQ